MVRRIIALLLSAVLLLMQLIYVFAEPADTQSSSGAAFEPAESLPPGFPAENAGAGGQTDPSAQTETQQTVPGQAAEQVPAFCEEPLETDVLWLRIGLRYGETAAGSIKLESDSGFLLTEWPEKGYRPIKALQDADTVVAECADGEVVVRSEEGEILAVLSQGLGLISAAEDPDGRVLKIGGVWYRDGVSFAADAQGRLTVVNRVTAEHYLWGVVPKEIGYYYPAEALKAQAVTARSYAAANIGRHKALGFDLCTGSECQVYGGVAAEKEASTLACKDTAGMVMYHGGRLAVGYYYAYSSGYTLNSEDVWVNSIGYLRGVKDEYAQNYVWKSSMSFDTMRQKLLDIGYECGEIQSVQVEKRLDNGAVYNLLIRNELGELRVSRSFIANALGSSTVKSQFFYIGNSGFPGKASAGRGKLCVNGEESLQTPEQGLAVMGADGNVQLLQPEELYVLGADGEAASELLWESSDKYTDEIAKDGTVWFTGFGQGHSVGMPQTSAKNMADAGKTWQEILRYYYTDIELQPLSQEE